MDSNQIQELLANAMTEANTQAEVRVEGGDGKFQVQVIADMFEGLNAVKRQQAIYKILNPHIQSGAIHAVSMHLRTFAEQG